MNISSLSAAAPTTSTSTSNKIQIAGDFTTFLNMLTVQLKNQDPLSPMESSEFAVQLATFSAVEQQAQTNALLTTYLQESGSGLAAFADLIGKSVKVTGTAHFGSSAIEMALPGHSGANSATLIVTDDNGDIAATRAIDPKSERYMWQPWAEDASLNGTYSVSVRYAKDGQDLGTKQVTTSAEVSEVENSNGETVFVLANGMRVTPANVSAILLPGQQ